MVDIEKWMQTFQKSVYEAFGNRILFIGLQGSYGRGEADENSDIDVVLILDAVSLCDLKEYRKTIENLAHREKICGFVAGKNELAGWDRTDLFQFYYDTAPVMGTMDAIISAPGRQEARCAALSGACEIYHGTSHNFLHKRSPAVLHAFCKLAAFALRAKYFYETGNFYKTRSELYGAASDPERFILNAELEWKGRTKFSDADFEEITRALIIWSSEIIQIYSNE